MATHDNDVDEPSWLDTEYDQTYEKEVEPLLFGTGKLTLKDPDEKDTENPFADSSYQNKQHQQDDASSEAGRTVGSNKSKNATSKKTKGYGSTTTTTSDNSSLWTIPTTATTTTAANNNGDSNDDDNDNDNNSKHQDDSNEDHSTVILYTLSGKPDRPKRAWPVKVFFAIESFAVMVCLGLIVSEVLPMIFIPLQDFDRGDLALKVYLCIFAVLFMVVEIDHSSVPFLRKAVFLTTYVTRGFFYTFLGLICFLEAYSETAAKMLAGTTAEKTVTILNVSWYALVNQIAAFSLISLGVLYFLMGVCCLQTVRNRYVNGDRQTWKAYREAMDKWDRDN